MDTSKEKLSSAEISQLWGTYMGDSSQVCMLSYFLNIIEDQEIKNVLEDAIDSCKRHLQKLEDMFNKEGQVIPHGFKVEEDVITSSPRLFTDDLFLEYAHQFGGIGLRSHAVNLTLAVRDDCTEFFKECLSDATRLFELSKGVLMSKGLFIKSPYIKPSKTIDYISHQNFLTGFLGHKRPLTAPEITNLYANFQRNALGAAVQIGFSQVAKNDEVSKYFLRGKEIAEKHCELFNSYLTESHLPASLYWDSQVKETTLPIFSDKLMMFITSALTGAGMGFYGLGLGTSFRRDISTLYNRILLEIELYAEDGANIMIKHGWLESPPTASE